MEKESLRTVITTLSWLNASNYDEKRERYSRAMDTQGALCQQAHHVVVNNGCNPEFMMRELDEICPDGFDVINLSKNYYDVAAHFVAWSLAIKLNLPYFIYSYDDFVYYDPNFVTDAESFMDAHPDVWCTRIVSYDSLKRSEFDVATTPKSVNPDSVRHIDGAGGMPLLFGEEEKFGDHRFRLTNWRPNSRPMMWRTSDFTRLVMRPHPIIAGTSYPMMKVMQPFESYMYDVADMYSHEGEYRSALMEIGACRTFSQDTSARIMSPLDWTKITTNVSELDNEMTNWLNTVGFRS